MKKKAYRFLTTFSLFVIMAAASVYAQSVSSAFVVKIPFEFVAGNKTLPAGEYSIKPIGAAPGVLTIQSTDYHSQTTILTESIQVGATQTRTRVVFKRYGDQYFLSQIWTFGSNRGRELPTSRVELELAKSESKPQLVAIAGQ